MLPLAKLEEQSKVEFSIEKLEPKLREQYLNFVSRKVEVPTG